MVYLLSFILVFVIIVSFVFFNSSVMLLTLNKIIYYFTSFKFFNTINIIIIHYLMSKSECVLKTPINSLHTRENGLSYYVVCSRCVLRIIMANI